MIRVGADTSRDGEWRKGWRVREGRQMKRRYKRTIRLTDQM